MLYSIVSLVLMMAKPKFSSLLFCFIIDGNRCPEASDNSFDLFDSTQAMAPKSGTNWVTAVVLGMTLGLLK